MTPLFGLGKHFPTWLGGQTLEALDAPKAEMALQLADCALAQAVKAIN